jgi:pentatricopeptide repeat domain-containing protein 1
MIIRQQQRQEQSIFATKKTTSTMLVLGLVLVLLAENRHAFTPAGDSSIRTTRRRRNSSMLFFKVNDASDSMLKERSLSTSLSMAVTTRQNSSSSKLSNADIDRKIKSLGRSGKTDEALQIYATLDRPTIRILNGAIDACARARPTRLDTAFEIFDNAMKTTPLKPNEFTFGSLINACNRARNAEKAMEVLRSMEKDYGVAPNAIIYSSAISACARSEPPKPELALQLLQEVVEEKKLQMSVVGFNAAIDACGKASDWENAISLLTRMEEATKNNNSNNNKNINNNLNNNNNTMSEFLVPEPDSVTYGTVLTACERGKQWKLILKNAESMQERGLPLDARSIMSCLHACSELGLAYEALKYLDTMKSAKSSPQQTAGLQRSGARKPLLGPDEVAYRCAISACARGGAWREGIQLLEEYKNATGTPANTIAYTAAITGCEYAGEWKEAFFLLDRMRKEGVEPNEITMAAVIAACATACSRDEYKDPDKTLMPIPHQKAMILLSLLEKDPNLVNPNIQIYNAAIRVCAESYDIEGAFRILQDAKDAEIERTEITYGSLMTACERQGCVDSASKVFRMMKEDDIEPNEIIYGAAISCFRKAREPQRCLFLLKKMMKEELSPNAATLNTVMIALTDGTKKSDSERVMKLYKLMNSEHIDDHGRPNRYTYNILINYFADNHQPAAAEAFLDKMRNDGFKPDVNLFTATVTVSSNISLPPSTSFRSLAFLFPFLFL